MSRIRVTCFVAGLVAIGAMALSTQAQQPGGGRGGRGGGGGFGGQRGGQGGFGGQRGGQGGPGGQQGGEGGGQRGQRGQRGGRQEPPGGFGAFNPNSLLTLAGNDSVQKELKATDRQKAEIKKLADDESTKRRETMQRMRQQMDTMKNQVTKQAQNESLQLQQMQQQAAQSFDNRGSGAGGAAENALNSRGFQPQLYGGQVYDQDAMDPAMQQQMAMMQGRMAGNAAQQQGFLMMRQEMQRLEAQSERDLGKILNKPQVTRLKEIQLQAEGPGSVLQDAVAQKLEIREEQVPEIQEAVAQAGQARREMMAKNFQYMRTIMPGREGGGRRGGQSGEAGQAAQGGGGGQAGGGRGRFDPEAMRKVLEQPEVKAKLEEFQTAQATLRDKEYAAVFKALDRRQVTNFKKLLGKPFDVDGMRRGFFTNLLNRPGENAAAAAKTATPKTETSAAATPKTDANATEASKSAPARRPSLRERRGLGGEASADSPK